MKYYIIAGEASGDLHGSNLIKAILKNDPSATIQCWGGDLMQQDLTKASERNVYKFINVIEHMPDYFDTTYFTFEDIVRSGLVKQYIMTLHSLYHEGY
jgi:lipid-A-disaccharide synthase